MVGGLTGTIKDPSGSVVPGVEVMVTNEGTQGVRTATSDSQGAYRVDGLFIGTYKVEAELKGFKRFLTTTVEIKATQLKRVDILLELGEVTDTVTVQETAAAIQTESPSLFVNMPKQALQRPLTNDSRGFVVQSLGWLPGSAPGGSWLLFGAGRQSQQHFNLEGGRFDVFSNFIAENAVSELQSVVNNAPAEYARPVTVNVALKSGSNELHGETGATVGNPCLNVVKSPFYSGPRVGGCHSDLRVLFGVGGPVYIPKLYDGRNKTFFRFSFHKNKDNIVNYANPVFSAPTLRMQSGDFSRFPKTILDPLTGQPFPGNIIPANRISETAKAFVKDAYGTPDTRYIGDPDNFVNNVQQTAFYGGPQKDWILKLDQNLGQSDIFNFTWRHENRSGWQDVTRPAWPSFIYRFDQSIFGNWGLGHTHTFSPTIVNQARVSVYRGHSETIPAEGLGSTYALIEDGKTILNRYGIKGLEKTPNVPGRPGLSITGWPGADYVINSSDTVETRYDAYENISFIKGNHTIKAGYSFYKLHRDNLSAGPTFGTFAFDGRFTSEAWADFVLGIPGTFGRFLPRPWIARRIIEQAAYIQDDWRITPSLTAYYGVRWGTYSPPYDKNRLYYNFDPGTGAIVVPDQFAKDNANPSYSVPIKTAAEVGFPSKLINRSHNFMPRLGFAWRPDATGRTVLRAGYGVYSSVVEFNQLQTGGPFGVNESFINQLIPNQNGSFTPQFSFPNPFTGTAGPPPRVLAVTGYDKNFSTPYVQQFQLSLERTLGSDWGIRGTYAGSKGTQLSYGRELNTPLISTQPFAQERRPYANFNSVLFGENGGNDYVHQMEIAVSHPFSKGLWFQAAYFLRHARSDVGFEGFAQGVATPRSDYAYDRSRDKGRYEAFPTHDFVTNWVWEPPIGSGRRFLSNLGQSGVGGKLLNGIIGGWAASGTLSIRGGMPFSPFYSNRDPGNINQFTGRPDQVPGCNVYEGQSITRWFNPACFTVPKAGTLGNFVRNSLSGPGGWIVVLNPYKDFPIPYLGEQARLRFGANIYNLFNHPVYGMTEQGGGVRDITNPAAGRITGLQNLRQPYGDMSGMRSILLRATFIF